MVDEVGKLGLSGISTLPQVTLNLLLFLFEVEILRLDRFNLLSERDNFRSLLAKAAFSLPLLGLGRIQFGFQSRELLFSRVQGGLHGNYLIFKAFLLDLSVLHGTFKLVLEL